MNLNDSFPVAMPVPFRDRFPAAPKEIPLAMLVAVPGMGDRAKKWYGVTLDDLARAGGADPVELIGLLDGVRLPPLRVLARDAYQRIRDAVAELTRRVAVWVSARESPSVVTRPGRVWTCEVCGNEMACAVQEPGTVYAVVTCGFCMRMTRVEMSDGDWPAEGRADDNDGQGGPAGGADPGGGTPGGGRPLPGDCAEPEPEREARPTSVPTVLPDRYEDRRGDPGTTPL